MLASSCPAVVFWDLSGPQEQKFLQQTLGQFEEGKLSSAKVESETFVFRLLPYAKPSIQASGQGRHGQGEVWCTRARVCPSLAAVRCIAVTHTPQSLNPHPRPHAISCAAHIDTAHRHIHTIITTTTTTTTTLTSVLLQNDVITLPTAMADPHLMKIAISFALAQSTKLRWVCCLLRSMAGVAATGRN